MKDKDILDFINVHFTIRANVDCFNKLNHFVDFMRLNQYYPISDEEIHRGVEYKKAEGKALLKCLDPIIPSEEKQLAETMIDFLCNQSFQQFLEYKHSYEKSLSQHSPAK